MSNNNEININIRITKKHLTVALIAIVAASLIIPYQIFAQNQAMPAQASEPVNSAPVSSIAITPLTNVFCTPTAGAVLIESNYIVSFTTATEAAIKFIDITWPMGFNVAGAMLVEKSDIGAGTLSIVGQTTRYTVTAPSPSIILDGTPIFIMISNIVNPATLSNTCTVITKNAASGTIDGPTVSAIFSLKRVGTTQILIGAVTLDKMAANSVGSGNIVSGVALTGSASIDSPTFAIDSVNHRVGIGTTTPDKALAIRASGTSEELVSFKDLAGATRWHINQDLGGANRGLNFAETGVADGRLFIRAGDGHVGIGSVHPGETLTVVAGSDSVFPLYITGPFGAGLIMKDVGNGSCHELFFRNDALISNVVTPCPST